MNNKRTKVSMRRRFDIFKRDGFRCMYCGRTPPTVILEIDHILPIAEGGLNEVSNLVTSCVDCNRGKAAGLLTNKPQSLGVIQEAERDRFEQLREYQQWLAERARMREEWLREISDAWITLDGQDPNEWRISGQRESTVRVFLDRLPAQEIIDALHIAAARHPGCSNETHFFKYFCGVCWNKIRNLEAA